MEIDQFNEGAAITAHSFSGDRSSLAISPNTSEVQIYTQVGGDFQLSSTLKEHDKAVTSIDWAPSSNRILTCSQDRNAYVWNLGPSNTWVPTLVLLRLNRSATFARWSPNEQKFAVASGSRLVAVCQFDDENNWWVAKHLKKPIRSTVLCLDWHPNSVLLATGGTDGKARVFSAYLKGADQKPPPTNWGDKLPFNQLCGEFSSPSGGWVHDVAFSPSGETFAFASHECTISVVYSLGGNQSVHHVVNLPSLPAVSLIFSSEVQIIAAGHDCQLFILSGSHDGWSVTKSLSGMSTAKNTVATGRLNSEAFNLFKASDSRGIQGGGIAAGMDTLHQNTITSVRGFEGDGSGGWTKVSTSGNDGRVVVWGF